jgi:hypothetical protein
VDFADPTALVEVAWEAVFLGNLDHVHDATTRAVALEDFVAAAVLAEVLGDAGRETEAAERLEEIITAAEKTVPPIELVRMRRMLARQLGASGQPAEALSLARAVVDDATREVGPHDHLTLAGAGDRAAALRRFEPLLADLAHLPADHWLVTETHSRYTRLHQP